MSNIPQFLDSSISSIPQKNNISPTNPSKLASVFGHVLASSALGKSFFRPWSTLGVLLLAGFCAFAPDLDVLGFRLGIPYESQWGHRGWTHSLVFALGFGVLMAALFYRRAPGFWWIALLCVLSTASHPLLDMLTNGGRGVALFWPFSLERLFFPFRPLQVSPLGAGAFFSAWGVKVLISEAIWIGGGAVVVFLLGALSRMERR